MSEFDFIFQDNRDFNSNEKVIGSIVSLKQQKIEEKLLNRFDELDKLLPIDIETNQTIHLISSDNFGSIELLKCMVKRFNITEMHIATWSYNHDFVLLVEDILKNGTKMFFCVDKSMKTRKAHLYAQMIMLSDNYPGRLSIKVHHMIHSKITLIKTKDRMITIEGSANYSNNQRIENFAITENKELFMFHRNWMKTIIGG